MLIAASLIELALPGTETIKERRRVARSIKDRIRQRFNVSVAEVADQDERDSICIGCVMVGIDPRHLQIGSKAQRLGERPRPRAADVVCRNDEDGRRRAR